MAKAGGKIDVTVKVFGGLRGLLGQACITISLPLGSDVERLLAAIAATHPELSSRLREGIERGYVSALLNGRNVRFLDGLETRLEDGDSLAFLPPVGGG